MKAVTVSYFSLQHALTSPVPTQFQTLCESSRLYEPGSQFMEYVKRMPEPMAGAQDRSVMSDPFHFEPYTLDAAARSASESAASSGTQVLLFCCLIADIRKSLFVPQVEAGHESLAQAWTLERTRLTVATPNVSTSMVVES